MEARARARRPKKRLEQKSRRKEWRSRHALCALAGPLQHRVSQIVIREGDSFEVALKRFTRKVQQDGVLSEAKRHQHYEPPSVKRKRQAAARQRRERKRQAKAAARGY